ncbi:MAG TPA: DUF1330 domain-containing protein [Terriglobales bacterium]|jgi:uncharacterized protein (DUF1330 family)|nr:DUF1330 domain-containing protein [Terriglobales bacterium]
MVAYFLVDILEVTDAVKMEDYKKRVGAVVEKFGGRYLVAGGKAEVAEGTWCPTFPVVIQFPSFEQAQRWYNSEDYRELKALRLAASRGNAVFLEGL